MKLEVRMVDELYNLIHTSEEGKPAGIRYDYIDLPSPLKGIGLVVINHGGKLQAHMPIIAEDEKVFHDSSRRLQRAVRATFDNRRFLASNNHGAGYILPVDETSQKTEPSICINSQAPENIRLLSLGSYGARSVDFPKEPTDFKLYMFELASMANCLIDAWLRQKNRGRLRELELQLTF